jgi:glycosyltransferase involved in cell wall biosynthesis
MDKVSINLFRALSTTYHTTLVVPYWQPLTPEVVAQMRSICSELILVPIKNQSVSIRRPGIKYWRPLLRTILLRVPALITDTYYPRVAKIIRAQIQANSPDLIQATSLATASYLAGHKQITTSIIFHDNAFELYRDYYRYSQDVAHKVMSWLVYRAYLNYEPKAYLKCDWALFLSQKNMLEMQGFTGDPRQARLLPLAVELEENHRSEQPGVDPLQEPNSLVFVGGFGPGFHKDAVLFFCRKIFPIILRHVPDARIYFVGENPSADMQRLSQPGRIIFTGGVPDVRPYIEKAAVYVAPLRFGGGLKTKMIEALSLSKAIVATSVAITGLWDLGEDVFQIQDDPGSFAGAVVDLLQNDARRSRMGTQARKLFERSYTFKAVLPKILSVYREIETGLGK